MDWSYFWLLIGGNAVATGAIAFFVKVFVEQKMKEQQSRFEHELGKGRDEFKAQLDKERVALELTFNKSLAAFTNRHSRLVEKQADILGELYSLTWEAFKAVYALSDCDIADRKTFLDKAKLTHSALVNYVIPKRIYFPKVLCEKVDHLMWRMETLRSRYLHLMSVAVTAPSYLEVNGAAEGTEQDVRRCLHDIENRFRLLIEGNAETYETPTTE